MRSALAAVLAYEAQKKKYTNKIRNPRGEGGVVGTVGVTNKCTGYNAAPPALVAMGTAAAFNSAVSGMVASGGDGSTLFGVVDDTSALQVIAATDPFIAAGLANGWLNGRVFKIDNSAGTGTASLLSTAVTGNTNTHSIGAYARTTGSGSASISIDSATGATNIVSASYSRLTLENRTPLNSTGHFRALATAGSVTYFILFSLVEASTAAPVPTVVAGAAATGALPTNWLPGSTYAAGTGINTLFLGVGTKNGRPYADVTLAGTAVGTGGFLTAFEGASYAAALAGQAWGADAGIELIAGTAPSGCLFGVVGRTSGGANPESLYSAAFTPAGLAQISGKGVLSGSTTVYVQPALRFPYTNGVTYNMGLRIYAPKLVQLAVIEGPELVTNGEFTGGLTSWSDTGANWSGVGDKAVHAAGDTDSLYQLMALVGNAVHKIGWTLSGYSAGAVRTRLSSAFFSNNFDGLNQAANGSYTDYIVAGADAAMLRLVPAGTTFVGSVDNISVKQVTPGYMPAFPILPPVGVPGDSIGYGIAA